MAALPAGTHPTAGHRRWAERALRRTGPEPGTVCDTDVCYELPPPEPGIRPADGAYLLRSNHAAAGRHGYPSPAAAATRSVWSCAWGCRCVTRY